MTAEQPSLIPPPVESPSEPPGVDVHGVQPWTVLRQDSRLWQKRKAWWRQQGLRDRGGRPHAKVFPTGPGSRMHGRISGQGGSVFDPVLTEACLTWYSPPGGHVLDPMAGGPTRGLVTSTLGRHYTGIDLLAEQVQANRDLAATWPHLHGQVQWRVGDAREVLPTLTSRFDYALTCPPYWRLERYSDDPRDLSAMGFAEFLTAHEQIIHQTADLLTDDTFATWVVGDLRGDDGLLCQMPRHTMTAFEAAGMRLVNDQILITPIGSLFWNLARSWRSTRSATRTHQYVLTFIKGDRRRAVARIKEATGE